MVFLYLNLNEVLPYYMGRINIAVFFFTAMVLVGCGAHERSSKADGVSGNHQKKLQVKYAKKLGVSPDEVENIILYKFVDDWIGVKYRYGGSDQRGVDCSGFANALYSNVYKKQLERRSKDIYKSCRHFGKRKLKEGDLVFFNIEGKKYSHIGVYLQNDKFVHASTSKGVIISDLNNPYYKKYFFKGGRP